MGLRLLALLLLAAAIGWIVKKKLDARRSQSLAPPAHPPAVMAQCSHCGVYLPRTQAVERDGRFYCSSQHADHPPSSGSPSDAD